MFSVGLTKNVTIAGGQYVVFDKVFVDIRQSYNFSTGVFVVPVTGLYEINYHIVGKEGASIQIHLKRNGL